MVKYNVLQIVDLFGLNHWYQPIYQLRTGIVIGYEAFLRDNTMENRCPDGLFHGTKKQGYTAGLDRYLLLKAQETARGIQDKTLFLNIFSSTLMDDDFIRWWEKHPPMVCSLVLEIPESEIVEDWRRLKAIVGTLRKSGVQLAIDCTDAECAFFRHWIELNPDYIKINRYYAENLASNHVKQQILQSIIDLTAGSAQIVLKGVERKEDLQAALEIGITHAQGYVLAQPLPWNQLLLYEEVVNNKLKEVNGGL